MRLTYLFASICVACAIAQLPAQASVRAIVVAQLESRAPSAAPAHFDPGPGPTPAPLRIDAPAAQPLRVDNAKTVQPHVDSVATPALRAQSSDSTRLPADIQRLRSLAGASSSRSQKGAARTSPNKAQANAAWVLGLLYLHGVGVELNASQAQVWFERAQALGEPLAVAGLAWCDMEGCSAQPNPALARRWLPALRAVNAPRAQYLEWLIESRVAPLQIASPRLGNEAPHLAASAAENAQLLSSAAQAGDVHANIELGLQSVAANRATQALAYFRVAAGKSQVAAENILALQDQLRTANKTTEPLSAQDAFAKAQRNHRGDGQPANYAEAVRWYQVAQNQGSAPAKKMLDLIFSRLQPDGQLDVAWIQQLAQINLAKDMLTASAPQAHSALRREPTAVFDLLPPVWKSYLNKSTH
jgi:uncharacterized protein